MPTLDDIVFSFPGRATTEAARRLVRSAQGVAGELSGVSGKGKGKLKRPACLDLSPIIPGPHNEPGQGKSWKDVYICYCVTRILMQDEYKPVTVVMVFLLGLIGIMPDGHRLWEVGLNAHCVLDLKEWRRLATAPLMHADWLHLASNCNVLMEEGAYLEARMGPLRFAALLASSALVSQGLYLGCTRLAKRLLPRSSLAWEYSGVYGVGFSGVIMSVKVVAGNMREGDMLAAGDVPEGLDILTTGRLRPWSSLLLSHFVTSCGRSTISLPMHLCGQYTGLLHVYGARMLGWLAGRLRRGRRRRGGGGRFAPAGHGPWGLGGTRKPRLGLADLGTHLLLGAGSVLMQVAARQLLVLGKRVLGKR